MYHLRLYRLFIISVVLLLCTVPVSAQSGAVNADIEKVVTLDAYAELLLTDQRFLLSDVARKDQWESYQSLVNIGSGQSLWIRFRIQNQSSVNRYLTFIAGNTFIEDAEAYVLDEQGRIVYSSRINNNDMSTMALSRSGFRMAFTSQAGAEYTVYLLIRDDGPSLLPLELWQSEEYVKRSTQRLIFIAALCGGLSLLSLHFLLAYILRSVPARFWFCVFATATMTTLLCAEGILPMLFLLPSYAAELTSVSIIVALFSALKITKNLFTPASRLWIRGLYLTLIIPLASIFLLTDFYQIITLLAITGIIIGNKLLMVFIYRNAVDLRSATIYFGGWIALITLALIEFFSFIYTANHFLFAAPYTLISASIGTMLIGVAIISREQSAFIEHNQSVTQHIQGLSQYGDLFEHSAEGLFIAQPNGDLQRVNPAACSLLGYRSEAECLRKVANLNAILADRQDLDLLLGELSIAQVVLGKEVKARRQDGSEFWISISSQLKQTARGKLQYGSFFDVTERRLHQINLYYLNTHDPLTGLFNRRYFLQLLKEKISYQQSDTVKFGVIFIDIDQFNLINNTCGHHAGDIFVKDIAMELFDVIGDRHPLARLSADHFGLIVEYEHSNQLRKLAEQLLERIDAFEFKWNKRIFSQNISIGIAVATRQLINPEELLSFAEAACQMAQEDSRNKIHIYSSELGLQEHYQRDIYWMTEVEAALEDERFELFYQHYRPLKDTDTRDFFEILVRLRTTDNDLIAPEFFMPSAEKKSISHRIDRIAIEQLFSWLYENPDRLKTLGRVHINLSGNAISDEDFKFFVINAFKKYQIPFDLICFEITETTAIIKARELLSFMQEFQPLGCQFAIDDFGSGFSSYSQLKSLPVNYVKIDGNFIRDILKDKIDLAMVTSIRDVANAMNIETIAEFVENQEIMVQVGKLGVDYAQGFYLAKPEPLSEFTSFTQR